MVKTTESFDTLGSGVDLATIPPWDSLASFAVGDGLGGIRPDTSSVTNVRANAAAGSDDMYARCRTRQAAADASGNGQVGIVVRIPEAANTGTGYMLMIEYQSAGSEASTILRSQVNNSRTNLTSNVAIPGYTMGDWVELEVRVEGDQLTGYVNGDLVHTTTTTTHPTGQRGGFYMFNNGNWEVRADDYEHGALSDLGGGDPAGEGGATGQTAWQGSATGAAPVLPDLTGAASGASTWTGTATGVTPALEDRTGTASGLTSWTGAATGAAPTIPDRDGTATGTTTWSGVATGTAPALPERTGAAAGATAWAGTAEGARSPIGTSAGATDWQAAATGHAPAVDSATGTAAGSTTWTGAASGITDRTAVATGTLAWTGAATGQAPDLDARTGSASGTSTWAGMATGQRHPKAAAAGAVAWAGQAHGATTRAGAAAGAVAWSGAAVGRGTGGSDRRDIELRLGSLTPNPARLGTLHANPARVTDLHAHPLTLGPLRRTP